MLPEIALRWLLGVLAAAFLATGWPGMAAALGLPVWVAARRNVSVLTFYAGKPVALTLAALVGGFAAGQAWRDVLSVAAGNGGFWDALLSAAIAAACGVFIDLVLKGKIMPNIFDLASDPQALEAFVSQSPAAPAEGGTLDLSHLAPDAAIAAIQARVIGQDAIVQDVVRLVYRRAALRRSKPVAVLLFVGATGAGKTELAKALADVLAGGRLIRVDCNEMTEAQSTQRLTGAPPGYVGSDQGGWLCREIGSKQTGVLLFDEIEKAHPDVFKLLMGLFDEGRLTEQSTGRTYSASGFVIVLTSNSAHDRIARIVAETADPQARTAAVKDALQGVFRPEQLARLDEVYPFGDLDRRAVVQIVGRFLQGFAADVGIALQSVDTALLIDLVTRREKLAHYGVREVVRLVEKAVLDGLLEARAQGYTSAAIEMQGDRVQVRGIATRQAAAR
ncbi:AAA family ATPase [Thiomonas sp.]|uniref:AAA family ATPase n=1 Tax=Thiomonas sp. TaxID=2047785 RepID=UPI002617B178|nr:AAA family ATPase [Thiomonas sp.]